MQINQRARGPHVKYVVDGLVVASKPSHLLRTQRWREHDSMVTNHKTGKGEKGEKENDAKHGRLPALHRYVFPRCLDPHFSKMEFLFLDSA